MLKDYLFSSESVNEGHPDKVCDQVSDAILDELLRQDPESRVACETLIKTGLLVVAGEITTTAKVDFAEVAKQVVREIGYTTLDTGFACDSAASLEGKARCKEALLEAFGLPRDPATPLFATISRLVDQKGFDLLAEAANG